MFLQLLALDNAIIRDLQRRTTGWVMEQHSG
jgi:hypothetical protein